MPIPHPPATVPLMMALPIALLGCAGDPDAIGPLGAIDHTDARQDSILSAAFLAAAPAGDHQLATQSDGGIQVWDPLSGSGGLVADMGTLHAAALAPDGTTLLATDGGLLAWANGALTVSGLDGAAPGTPIDLRADGSADLWLQTTEGLWLWRAGWLHELRVGDQPATGPFAPGGEHQGHAVTWATTDAGTYALDDQMNVVAQTSPLAALAVDATGALVGITAAGDWTRPSADDTWATSRPPEPAVAAMAQTSANGAWVLSASTVWRVHDGQWTEQGGLDPAAAMGVDASGALILADANGVTRVSPTREVALFGPASSALDGPAEIALLAAHSDELEDLGATVGDLPITVAFEDGAWRGVIDPALIDGTPTLQAWASWADGERLETDPTLLTVTGSGVITWTAHIEPLYFDNCAICHGGDTETELDTPELWEARVEDILVQVESGAMPIGSDPLTDSEIARIESWRDGGFPLE